MTADRRWAQAIEATGRRFEDGTGRVVAKPPAPPKQPRVQVRQPYGPLGMEKIRPSNYVGRLMGWLVTRNRTSMTLAQVRKLFGNSPDFIHERNLSAKGIAAAKAKKQTQTNCKRGHPLSGDNLFLTSNGARGCKACRVIHKRKYRSKANG